MSTYSVSDAISVEGSRASGSPRGSDRRLAEKLRHRGCRGRCLDSVRPVIPVVARPRRLVADLRARHLRRSWWQRSRCSVR
jgi:hypothetical protein